GLNCALPGMHPSLDLTIATTKGQDDRVKMLNDPEGWVKRSHHKGTITFWLRLILWGMALVDGFGFCAASVMLCQKWASLILIAQHWWSPLFMTAAQSK
ncbi:MAG: hypothetical protein WBX18_18445, partial [Terracidiphilus sp.]